MKGEEESNRNHEPDSTPPRGRKSVKLRLKTYSTKKPFGKVGGWVHRRRKRGMAVASHEASRGEEEKT